MGFFKSFLAVLTEGSLAAIKRSVSAGLFFIRNTIQIVKIIGPLITEIPHFAGFLRLSEPLDLSIKK
jgi:hypothetical protein